ncbi:MAG: iron-containing alcohol dehydrogenase [Dictyoglomus sp.]|nr:iron-containing alcohol dehydrogenase [Dictyoglomus sp.]MDW8187955.1 iron-containing alcohol dehydrogenase [Dictyoglomus sp.]
MNHFSFYFPVRIKFGIGIWENLAEEALKFGRRFLLVTGKRHLKETGILEKIEKSFNNYQCELFIYDKIPPEPPYYFVDEGAEIIENNNIDAVIGIGGGSALDIAKAIAVKCKLPDSIWNYIGADKIPKKGLPCILIPTTAGTGSEVTRVSVLINPETKEKLSIASDYLYPDVAIVDPYLTLTLPPDYTAYSGIDAFIHALESFLSLNNNLLTESISLKAIKLIYSYLPRVYKNGERIDLREKVLYASTFSGIALTLTGLGAIHALAHPVGVFGNLPHGLSTALVTLPVLEYNLEILSREKLMLLGRTLGIFSIRSAKERILKKVKDLFDSLNIRLGLRNYNIKYEDLPLLAKEGLKSRSIKTNPREIREEILLNLLQKAW